MIKFVTQISKKDKKALDSILQEYVDVFSDFYMTKQNLRLFIKDNRHLLFDSLKGGDKIAFSEDDGLAFVTGWSDNMERKYLKILAKDNESANKLLKVLLWNIDTDLYIKIKKNNPILSTLQKNNFVFRGNRGKEILLVRKYLAGQGEI